MTIKIYVIYILTLLFFGWKLTGAAEQRLKAAAASEQAKMEFLLKGAEF
jgi:hypothetical protein